VLRTQMQLRPAFPEQKTIVGSYKFVRRSESLRSAEHDRTRPARAVRVMVTHGSRRFLPCWFQYLQAFGCGSAAPCPPRPPCEPSPPHYPSDQAILTFPGSRFGICVNL
jgi:hypothetical protein